MMRLAIDPRTEKGDSHHLPVAAGETAPAVGREKGDSHHLPVAAGDTAPAVGRGLETNGGCHLFPISRNRHAAA